MCKERTADDWLRALCLTVPDFLANVLKRESISRILSLARGNTYYGKKLLNVPFGSRKRFHESNIFKGKFSYINVQAALKFFVMEVKSAPSRAMLIEASVYIQNCTVETVVTTVTELTLIDDVTYATHCKMIR